MGKGTIKSNLGDGQYLVEIDLDQLAKTRLLSALELKIEAANQVVETLKSEIETMIDDTPEDDPEEDPEILEDEIEPDPDPDYDEEDPPETGTASIAGRTKEGTNMANLAGITVTAFRYHEYSGSASGYINAGSATTAEDGTFTIPGLPAGSYTLKFSDATGVYKTEYYSDQDNLSDSTKFTVAEETAVTSKNATLVAASSISGTITG